MRCVASVSLPLPLSFVTPRRCCFVIIRSPCSVLRRRGTRFVSSHFSRTRNIRNSRASRRDRFARVSSCNLSSAYALYVYTSCETFFVLQILSKEILLFGVKLFAREEEGERRSPHVGQRRRAFAALRFSKFSRYVFCTFCTQRCLCVYVYMRVCARRTFRVPFGCVFSLSERSRHHLLAMEKCNDSWRPMPQIVPACLIAYIVMPFKLQMQSHFHFRNIYDYNQFSWFRLT